MNQSYESLKAKIKSWYPDQDFTDYELAEMTDRLVKVFTLGAKEAYRYKKAQKDKPT